MIDWTGFNKKASDQWVALSLQLLQKVDALLVAEAPGPEQLREAQRDLGEFVQQATLQCPPSARTAATRASKEITLCLSSLEIADLERRVDRLDAIRARLRAAGSDLKAEAAALGLERLRGVLSAANKVGADLNVLIEQVGSLTKAEMPGEIGKIAKQVGKIIKELEAGIKAL
jgi:hypothetical protein